jgi:hypothetical protein
MGFAENFISSFLAGKSLLQQQERMEAEKEERKFRIEQLQHRIRGEKLDEKFKMRGLMAENFAMQSGRPQAAWNKTAPGEVERLSSPEGQVQTPIPGFVPEAGMAAQTDTRPEMVMPGIEEMGIGPTPMGKPPTIEEGLLAQRQAAIEKAMYGMHEVSPGASLVIPGMGPEAIYTAPGRVAAADTPAPGSFGDFLNAPPERQAQIAEARQRYGQADDRAVDPTVAAIRDIQLENMRRQGNTTPVVQRQRDALAARYQRDPIVNRTVKLVESKIFVESLDPNSTNPADDQALIYAFAKAMDPDSAVREGEYATVQKYNQSWIEKLGFNAARIVDNKEFLTPEARANIKSTILKRATTSERVYRNLRKEYGTKINKVTGGDDGEEWLIDSAGLAGENPAFGQAPPPATPSTPGEIKVGKFIGRVKQ